MTLTEVLLCLVLVAALAAAIGAWRRRPSPEVARMAEDLERARARFEEGIAGVRADLLKDLAEFRGSVVAEIGRGSAAQAGSFLGLEDRVRSRLDEIRKENSEALEKIRASVDERLQETLDTRIGESFRRVGEQLEQVHRGLGEMQALAASVGDLRSVLTNVKTRGGFGEVQLGALLEQVLAPGQFERNVATAPGSAERVEYAIRLPGREGEGPVWLPVDAKFPLEDWQRIEDAGERGDAAGVAAARTDLRRRLLAEAEKIRQKYVHPPETTDFALLYLPTEALFAEALRLPGLVDDLHGRHRVVPAGPTTLFAILSSLQMGFRTLAIEKRSAEVWRVLAAVKTEFGKFGEKLDALSKSLEGASRKAGEIATRRRAVERKLREVEALPGEDAAEVLGTGGEETEAGEAPEPAAGDAEP